MRIGTGYDSHRFDPERELVLGGVGIPDHPGLAGHSDGDAIAHAVIDAVLGAASAGSIGGHFPPTDERWSGANSLDLLGRTVGILGSRDYKVVNVDVTVICESPKIAPLAAQMAERMAQAMSLNRDQISIKGKSNEGMGWTGSGEGLAVHAVALIESLTGRRNRGAPSTGGAWPL
jgi:2-C-methyl-D-erythritol 2,4-cyclodiphosphate synthase